MELSVLLEPTIDFHRLAEVLDGLGHQARVDTIRGWNKATQAAMFEAAAGRKITLDNFVPSDAGPLVEVIHHGKNTLPAFTHFQKRFCKPKDADVTGQQLWGYNHQTLSWATGPGYFVTVPGETAGEVDIDYRKIPTEKPESWPPVQPNSVRLGGLVYGGMVDVMRGVSEHVTIGRARKKGKWMDAWFVLCREPLAPVAG
jgi:hypothetical protein